MYLTFAFVIIITINMIIYNHISIAKGAVVTKGLTLSPLRSELNIDPGTSLDGVLTVTNSTVKPMKVNLSAEEFSVINRQYDYAFTDESDISNWAKLNPSEIDLSAGESRSVIFTIGVPLYAEPGGRYISLFASSSTNSSETGVMSRQRIASLLYINVSGDVTRSGSLVSLSSPWAISGNSVWSAAIRNTGSTHFRSRYNVQLKSLWGDGVVNSTTGDALILPGTVRSISDNLPVPQLPGIYKYIYTIGLGDTPAKVEARCILYVPPLFTLLFVATITALGLWFFQVKRGKH
jgi:hypothetical protein